jgi:agmatinase
MGSRRKAGFKQASPRFAGSLPGEARGADVVIWGLPTDSGAGTGRTGAAGGPRAIREASNVWNTVRTSEGYEFPKHGRVVDLGDLDLAGLDARAAQDAIRAGAPEMPPGRLTVAIGGDHSVTLPILESSSETWGLVYFDAHPDCIDAYRGEARSHACVLRRLVEAGRIDPARTVVVGLRAPEAEEVAWLAARGVETLTSLQVGEIGVAETCRRALERTAGPARYLSLDMDVLDASCVPGVENPEAGGLSSREVLHACRLLAGEFRALDLVEVTGDADPAGITAKTAARVLLDLIGGHVARRAGP